MTFRQRFKESYDNEEYENNQYENNFVIDFDEEGYFRALNSLINETDESDIEPDDTESELSEVSELDEDFYQVIGQDTDSKLTSCVLIDYIDGTYRTCGQVNCKKRLRELIGIWQIDSEIVTAVKNDLSKLGVCMSHFNFDQRIHKKKIKSMTKSTEESCVQQRQCLFCHQNHHYFTRGIGCMQHLWVILDRVILTLCIGQIDCHALKESGNFCKSSLKNFFWPRFSCGNCFVDKGGHLYTKPEIRPTKHTSEPTISESVSEEIPDVPSLFMLHVGMQLKQINIEAITREDLKDQFCQDLGKQFALKLWKSQIELTLNKNQLQNPQSIDEYVSSFPSWLMNFFYAFLTVFQTPLQTPIIETKHDEKALVSHRIFGINITAQKILDLYDEILDECLGFYYSNNDHENLQFRTNFDISTVHKKLIERMDRGCFGDLQHVVILEAGEVLKKEKIDTTGRRVKEVLVTKYKDIEKPFRKRKKTNILDNQSGSSDEPPKKRVRRIPSKEAVEILAPMVAHSLPSTKEEVQ
ncbi:unnamed protein product [Rhizophagus irregularis]|nr:unnamed protein product [Rhizophagus irregularis]